MCTQVTVPGNKLIVSVLTLKSAKARVESPKSMFAKIPKTMNMMVNQNLWSLFQFMINNTTFQ